MTYPNYRVSVEIFLKKDNKVLIGKRVPRSDVDPGVWTMPAGKVKYDEVPLDAVIREAQEETGLDVKIVKELDCRAFTLTSKGEPAYRLLFSYLVEQTDESKEVVLNDEHSECAWINLAEVDSYPLKDKHKELIRQILD